MGRRECVVEKGMRSMGRGQGWKEGASERKGEKSLMFESRGFSHAAP